MNAIPYTVTVDRRAEWEAKAGAWKLAETRSQTLRQSADTVAGRRADFDPGREYARAEMADAQDRETDPEFAFSYGRAQLAD